MRRWILSLALLGAACGAPSAPETDAETASQPATFESEALVGVWSFDRSCASGDGMQLNADGTAGFDEWGQGTWAVADGPRVVLTLQRDEPGAGPTGQTEIYHLDIAGPVTDDLTGRLNNAAGDAPRDIRALRCPELP